MANKTLTARVKLNTTDFEAKIKRITKSIDAINRAVGKQSNAYNSVNSALKRSENTTRKVKKETDNWANSQKKVNNALNSTKSGLGAIGTKLKSIVGTYLGLQTIKLGITASDTVTSVQNRLNNLDGGNPQQTAETMDKIYTAAQRSRTGYDNMLKDVSKTMTLAPDAFQGNIDNAIRFQEIMAKSYTIGGASAQEQATSMYQMVQALGSGVLQGDELRSVREGAPLAYQAIEKFAQGVYDTEESLKDLASQGKITSDMVVAAIMDSEEEISKKFENTAITFAQAWTMIKNTAMKAFQPALEALNKMLNSDAGKAAIEGISEAMIVLGNTLTWLINLFTRFFSWIANNWEWIKYIIVGALTVIGVLMIKTAAIAIWSALKTAWAWIKSHWALLLIVAGIMAILYVYELWRQGTITTTEAITYCLLVIATVALIAGIIMMSIPLLILAIVLAVLALIFAYFSEICGGIMVGIQAIVNAWFWCGNVIFGIWEWLKAVFHNAIEFIKGTFFGCVEWVKTLFSNLGNWFATLGQAIANVFNAVCDNIGIAFSNVWTWAKNTFWEFIADVIDGVGKLEPVINGIASLLGKDGIDFSSISENIRGKKTDYKEFVSIGDAWNSAWDTFQWKDLTDAYSNAYVENYVDTSDAWNKGFNTYDVFQDGWATNAYNQGYDWGKGIENKVNDWGSQWQTGGDPDEYGGIFSDLSNLLGLNGSLPDPNDPKYAVDGAYDPSGITDKLGGIKDDTGKIKDSMELKDEDLEYIRKIAEMEWHNEFTTAEIKVDMTNHNTVNGDRDLDGIVSYLSDVLREEMTSVAYGVHY